MKKIWIRTQDGTELILCDYFRVRCHTSSLKCDIVTKDCITLGTYENEVRALEVLDMIMLNAGNTKFLCMPKK